MMKTQTESNDSALALGHPIMVENARVQGKGKPFWLEILIFILVFLISSIIESILEIIPMMIGLLQTETYQNILSQTQNGTFDMTNYMDAVYTMLSELSSWVNIAVLFSTAGLILTVLFYCTKIEKRRLNTLGLTRKRKISEYLFGLLIGLLLFTLVWGLNLLVGGVSYNGIIFETGMIPLLTFYFFGYMVQGASEEILCHGYLCVSISRRAPLWAGLLINSVAFSLLHLANTGVSLLALLNIFLFGVFLTVYMIRRGNLWGACAIHSVWNFAQGNLFGLPVSGIDSGDSVLSTSLLEDKTIWNGGTFGPEGGLCVTFVLIVAILSITLFCQNQNLGQETYEPLPESVG